MPSKPKLGDVRYRHTRGTCVCVIEYFNGRRWRWITDMYRAVDAKREKLRLKLALADIIREARETRDE